MKTYENHNSNVICIESAAFYQLLDEVVEAIAQKNNVPKQKWVSTEAAMAALNISSKTTLQELRDDDQIRYTQPRKKIILYDIESIDEYLEKHASDKY